VHARVALRIQHATHMPHIVSFAACLAPPHFSTLSLKRQDFREKKLVERKMFSFSVQLLFKTFLILRGID
jgi:hypothetical protein